MATKLSDLLEVSLDYLVGKVDIQLDSTTMQRIISVSKFSDEDKNHLYAIMDAFIAKAKWIRL